MSTDQPLVDQSERDPQSWNLYAYARNNPLRFVDPTGSACRRTSDGNFEGDCASPGDEKVTQADIPLKVNVTATVKPEPQEMSSFASGVIQGLNDRRQASNQIIGGFAGITTAGGVIGGAIPIVGGTGIISLGIGATRVVPLLTAVPSALVKLQKIGLSLQQAIQIVNDPASQKLIDRANGNNINVVQQVGDKLVRITLDPTRERIISAGYIQARNLANSIAAGRFIKIE